MKLSKIIAVSLVCGAMTAYGQNKTYFVSPQGDDNASGLSMSAAWKSIEKVNSVVFQPGDKLLFQSGEEWKGQLKPKGSGTKEAPILLSKYGGEARPIINMGEAEGACIRLENQSWWTVDGIEVTSGAQPKLSIGRQGIVAIVRGENIGVEGITVRNCYVHDIWGQLGGDTEYCGYNSCGILVQVQGFRGGGYNTNRTNTTLNNVLIEDNRIERFDKCGIIVRGCKNNLLVRRNYMENLGGDGIFVGGCYRGIIEYNIARRTCLRSGYLDLVGGEKWWPHTAAIWIQDAEETIMQFNQVYDTGRQPGNGDGFAYDFDFYCKRCIAQYNYSKNNHGFLLLMNRIFENVARYNISENDQTHLVQMQCATDERNILYNNIFYIDHGTVDLDFFCGNDGEKDPSTLGAAYYNNIFYATGQSHFRTAYSRGEVLTRTFDEKYRPATGGWNKLFYNNCYFGPWKNGVPDDPKKLEADPQFVAPGTGGEGLCSLGGYRLKPTSPCINAGLIIPNAGLRDFFGNPLEDGHPDIGAYEELGSGVFADMSQVAAVEQTYSKESEMALAKWIFPLQVYVGNEEALTLRLTEALNPKVEGTITLIAPDGKRTDFDIAKQKQRDLLTLKTKLDQATLLASKLEVSLQYEDLSEKWEIPIKNRKR